MVEAATRLISTIHAEARFRLGEDRNGVAGEGEEGEEHGEGAIDTNELELDDLYLAIMAC